MPGLTSLEADKEPSVAVEEAITHWSLGQVGMVVRLHHLREGQVTRLARSYMYCTYL